MRLTTCLILALLFYHVGYSQNTLHLIPWPQEVKPGNGSYLLKSRVIVSSNLPKQEWTGLFQYFRDEMKKNHQITVMEAAKGQKADIRFEMRRMPTSGKAAYQLVSNASGIVISSNFGLSAFHGIQTFFQLLPIDVKDKKEVPFVEIFDHARFEYRGMHLDVGRHFFPVSFIKKYIDYLAYHKFNRFHWHLTEDQGWRIEIRKYPLLTSVGGWRNGTIIGRYPGRGNDNVRYGGFYTQAEIKDVVNYARQRHIDVIPEIEMPGHSSAAIAAYPSLSCFPGKPTVIPPNMISRKSIDEQKNGRIKLVQETWGVFDDVFCAGKDSTFTFLQDVIDEVIALFPSRYFHIGGDECPKTHWKQCPQCQQRMKENNLKDEHELQSYFVQRIEKYLNSKGKTLIGWDEILEGGLAPNAVVMSWRGETGGVEAAKQHHQVIMTPGNPVYFDHTQSQNEDSITIGGYNPLEKVYAYEPIPAELNEEQGKFVLGAQANVWTEYMKNIRKVEYMVFPRMSALSEVLWSSKENRNWESFEKRLPTQMLRYEKWKANYSKSYYDLSSEVLPGDNEGSVKWKVSSKRRGENYYIEVKDEFIYDADTQVSDTIPHYDITDPTKIVKYNIEHKVMPKGSKGYKRITGESEVIVPVYHSKPIIARQVLHHTSGPSITQQFHFNKATGKNISLQEVPSRKYPGNGAFTLVDGIQNEKGLARSREFLGFDGNNCTVIINLGKDSIINEIVIHTFEQQASWIYFPSAFDVSVSPDGQTFFPINTGITISKSADKDKASIKLASPVHAKNLKLVVMNYGVIPTGQPGAGNKAWLFVDEIEVN